MLHFRNRALTSKTIFLWFPSHDHFFFDFIFHLGYGYIQFLSVRCFQFWFYFTPIFMITYGYSPSLSLLLFIFCTFCFVFFRESCDSFFISFPSNISKCLVIIMLSHVCDMQKKHTERGKKIEPASKFSLPFMSYACIYCSENKVPWLLHSWS